jgi:hypothetical protein
VNRRDRRWSKRVSTGRISRIEPDFIARINNPFAGPAYKSSIQIAYKYDGVTRQINFLPILNWTTGIAEAVPA